MNHQHRVDKVRLWKRLDTMNASELRSAADIRRANIDGCVSRYNAIIEFMNRMLDADNQLPEYGE